MAKMNNIVLVLLSFLLLSVFISCESDQYKNFSSDSPDMIPESSSAFSNPELENFFRKYNKTKFLFDSLKYYESLNDQKHIIRIQTHIAEVCRESGNYVSGLKFLNELLSNYGNIAEDQLGKIFNVKAAIYYELYIHNKNVSYNLDTSLSYAAKSFEMAESIGDNILKSNSLNILGAIRIHKGNFEGAKNMLEKAHEINQKTHADVNLGILSNLAYVNFKLNNIDTALVYAEACLKSAVETDNFIFSITALKFMSDIYQSQSNSDMALKMNKKLEKLKSQKDLVLKSLILKRLILENEKQTAQKKILGLYHDRYYFFRLSVILIISILILVIIAILLVMYLRKMKKVLQQKLNLREKENQINLARIKNLDQEKQLKQEKAERLKLELQLKEQEMVSQSLKQAGILQMNDSIKEKLTPFIHKFSRKKEQEDFSRALEAICRESKRDPLSDFEQMFLQMHGGFYEMLTQINPDFTRSELQISALLRMNLPSKEIAGLMNVTVSRVDQVRHHIRTKLGIDKDQNLISCLNNIEKLTKQG